MLVMNIPYPFKDSTHITFRFIRRENGTTEENDDMVSIVPQGGDLFHVYFKDGDWTEKTSHMIALTGDELDAYITNLFFLSTRDTKPFRSIQLNIPCMPIFMLSIDDLKKKGVIRSLSTILPIMRSCIKVKW